MCYGFQTLIQTKPGGLIDMSVHNSYPDFPHPISLVVMTTRNKCENDDKQIYHITQSDQ